MSKKTEDILIAFCLHEKLSIPYVKALYKQQTKSVKRQHLKDMLTVINTHLRLDDTESTTLGSSRTHEKEKDDS